MRPILQRALLALVLLVTLGAISGCKPSPCPTRGWAPDHCVEYGEFPLKDKTLYIPNKSPNKYRWQGSLKVNKTNGAVEGPNLGVYWKTGAPAGGDVWPESKPDLIRFLLSFNPRNPAATNLNTRAKTLRLKPLDVALPFSPPPGLQLTTSWRFEDLVVKYPEQMQLIFVESNETGDTTMLIYCPPLADGNYKKENTFCSGVFYAQPGLQVEMHLRADAVKDWREITNFIRVLVKSWEKK